MEYVWIIVHELGIPFFTALAFPCWIQTEVSWFVSQKFADSNRIIIYYNHNAFLQIQFSLPNLFIFWLKIESLGGKFYRFLGYPLEFNISMQNGPFLDDLFIAMSVDQRVPATCASMYGWFSQREMFTIDFLMVFPWSSMFFHVFPMVFGVVFHGKSNDFPMTSPTWSRLGRLWCLEEHAGRRGWRAQHLGLRGFGLGMSGDGQDAQLKNSIDANLLLDTPFKSQKMKGLVRIWIDLNLLSVDFSLYIT